MPLRRFLNAQPAQLYREYLLGPPLGTLLRLHRLKPRNRLRKAFEEAGYWDPDWMAFLVPRRFQRDEAERLRLPPG